MTAFSENQGDGGDNRHGPVLVVPDPPRQKKTSRWVQRTWLVVFVLFCLEVGIMLTLLPWTRIWTGNSLVSGYPDLRDFLNYGFVRGLVTGLGLVDIWMGVSEAINYRES